MRTRDRSEILAIFNGVSPHRPRGRGQLVGSMRGPITDLTDAVGLGRSLPPGSASARHRGSR